jgi:digeranylgeranylglycerophospholipid reductase
MSQLSSYDVVVVGSGPAGATTARVAAERGLDVLLVDKKQELGAPIQCSGAVSAHALSDADIAPNEEFVSTPIFGFAVYDAAGQATRLDYRLLKPNEYQDAPLGYVVDRRRFDRYLMTLAERAGAEVWLKTEALGYTPQNDGLAELQLKQFGQPITVRTRVIVGADGVQSQVGKWANLRTHIKLNELASCLQLIVDRVETNGLLELVTGYDWAPGGYAWLFPKGHGYAEVGLGVIRTMTDRDARWHLDHFMRNSFMAERFKDSRVLEVQGGGVPLAAPLKRQYADHIILVGDAARHVNPITGGGIHTALRGGVIAGSFLGDFLPAGQPPTAEHLAGYQQRWLDEFGDTMWKLYRLKTDIFREKDLTRQDQRLHEALSGYFHPGSPFRKV